MTSRPETAKQIFVEAIEQYSSEQWPEFLDNVCRENPELRDRVELLLKAHTGKESVLDRPLMSPDSTHQMVEVKERPGGHIGHYKLIERIGEGGMGLVFMAEQLEPVRRKVAIKILKLGLDTEQVVARFEAERQALAMMNHPHIAKVLDAGATESGRPYFVMELVKGIPITEYCNQQKFDIHQRLELFITVCRAIQHAHQKGIIHRDLKPGNVLVELHDVTAVPKVIDFGVAKAIDQHLTEHTYYTNFSQMIGTPQYMSPEQAQLSGLDVDTRSDVYSLGVLLYELLTGLTPFEKEKMKQASYDELRRIIREDEPLRPSARVSTLKAEQISTISGTSKFDQRKLSSVLRGELDWIVMKSLEKDRTRRYETANELAADIRRYLNDEPVIAGPPTAAYRFKKFARRNKAVFAFSSLAGIFLVLGCVGLVVSNLMIANREKERQLALEEAQENLRHARTVVDEYLTTVSEEKLLDIPAMRPLRKELMELALDYYEKFVQQYPSDKSISSDLALAHHKLMGIYRLMGLYDKEIAAGREAVATWSALIKQNPENKEFRAAFADSCDKLGERLEWHDGSDLMQQAFKLRKSLAENEPSSIEYQRKLAESLYNMSRLQINVYNNSIDAGNLLKQAIAIQRDVVSRSPDSDDNQIYLAWLLHADGVYQRTQGKHRNAIASFDESVDRHLTYLNQHPEDLDAQHSLGVAFLENSKTLWTVQKVDEALDVSSDAINTFRELAIRDSDDPNVLEHLVQAYANKVNIQIGLKLSRESAATQTEAIDFLHSLAEPINLTAGDTVAANRLFHLTVAYRKLFDALELFSNWPAAERAFDLRLKIARELTMRFPSSQRFQITLMSALSAKGEYLAKVLGEFQQAARCHEEAIAISKQFVESSPDLETGLALIRTYRGRADLLYEQKQFESVIENAVSAIELAVTLLDNRPNNNNLVGELVRCHSRLFTSLMARARTDEAKQYSQEVVTTLERAAKRASRPTTQYGMAWFFVVWSCGSPELIEFATDRANEFVNAHPNEMRAWLCLGGAHYRAGNYSNAQKCLEKADSLSPEKWRDPVHLFLLAMTHWRTGDQKQAQEVFKRAERVMWPGNGTIMTWYLQQEAATLLEITDQDHDSNKASDSTNKSEAADK